MHHNGRVRWIVLALLPSACAPPASECEAVTSGLTPPPLAIEGGELELDVRHPAPCYAGAVTAEAAALDPLGRSVPVEVRVTTRRSGGQVAARLAFTPLVPGLHHLSVRFQPNLGLEQLDVPVARDRRQAPAAYELEAGAWAGCRHVDVLPSGAPICLPPPDARAGSVLWRTDGGELSRWVERDGGLVREPDAAVAHRSVLLLPGADDVVAFAGDLSEVRVRVDGGQLEAVEAFPYLGFFAPAVSWTAWRSASSWALLETNGCESFVDAGFCDIAPYGVDAFLGTGPEGIIAVVDLRDGSPFRRFELIQARQRTGIPVVDGYAWGSRKVAEWDTGAILTDPAGSSVLLDWDGGLSFTAYGHVTSATSQWVTVERGGKLLLLHR